MWDWNLVLQIFLVIVGFALLIKGADWFVEGASGIAGKMRIPALVIGLTVVAFGTSFPELAVSVTGAIKSYWQPGATDIAIGNVVGSNIINILLILGLSALIHKLPVQNSSLRLDIPVLIVASALLVGLGAWGNALQWWDGLILLVIFAGYMTLLFLGVRKEQKELAARGESQPVVEKTPPKNKFDAWKRRMLEKAWVLILLTLVGLGMVVGGGTLLVNGAQTIAADYLHVSERIIALTVVAIGTSLPELVTSVVAAAKGETDIAVGNIIGSNIFNIFLVAGVSSLVFPLTFTISGNLVDALVALGAALLLLLCALVGKKKIGRVSGSIMVLSFIGYYVYLFLTLTPNP